MGFPVQSETIAEAAAGPAQQPPEQSSQEEYPSQQEAKPQVPELPVEADLAATFQTGAGFAGQGQSVQ